MHDLPCAAQLSQSTRVCALGPVLLGTTHCRLHLCPAGTHQTHVANEKKRQDKKFG